MMNKQQKPLTAKEVRMRRYESRAYMTGLCDGRIRNIDRALPDLSAAELADAAFEKGQNDYHPQDVPSVSVGDIIEIISQPQKFYGFWSCPMVKKSYHLVERMGFSKITEQQAKDIVSRARRDNKKRSEFLGPDRIGRQFEQYQHMNEPQILDPGRFLNPSC